MFHVEQCGESNNMVKLFLNEVVIETAYFTVGQDWEVPIPGFLIVAARRKLRSISEFTDEEVREFGFLLRKLRQGMRDVLGISDVYLFQNEDTEHNFHFWIFPRHPWMEQFGRKIESVRPIMKYAVANMATDAFFQEVKEVVSKLRGYIEGFQI